LRPAQLGQVDGLEAEAVLMSTYHDADYEGIDGNGTGNANGVDPEIAGLPVFIPDERNPEEAAERLAPTSIVYPGEPGRDLRRAAFQHQPPAAPRLSIIPTRPDWSVVNGEP
jgi:hypothetical protein